jgi:hypothetical protein
MTVMTTTRNSEFQVLREPALPSFLPGDVVVIPATQPLVCVVLEEAIGGRLRLSYAACPEAHLMISTSEVQHLSVWLMAQVSPARRPGLRGDGDTRCTSTQI